MRLSLKRWQKWALGCGAAAVVLIGAAYAVIASLLPSNADLAAQLTAEAEEKLGVKVLIGSVHWSLFPSPVVVIEDFHTQQAQPVGVRRLTAHLDANALLHRKLIFERIDVDGAVFPHDSLLAFRDSPKASPPDLDDGAMVKHFAFRDLTWISYSGIAVTYDGEVDFDAHWRPRYAELRRPKSSAPFLLTLARDGDADNWKMHIVVGGGTADGSIAMQTTPDGTMHVRGQLAPHDVEIASAMSSFNRRSSVGGKGSGQTTVSADGKSARELARSLHTRTIFSVGSATIFRFHLDKAINTRGKDTAGQTDLQQLTGQMDTQNTDDGLRVTFSDGKARAGIYSATGEGTVYKRRIDASGTMFLVIGAVGVPFGVHGPVENPVVSVPPGYLAGAAIGTAVMPGIGTVIGARIGGVVGRIFDGNSLSPAPKPQIAKTK